jgi:hypothetical protein
MSKLPPMNERWAERYPGEGKYPSQEIAGRSVCRDDLQEKLPMITICSVHLRF